MLYRLLFSFPFLFFFPILNAQTDSTWAAKPALDINAFVDAFYGYDFDRPKTEQQLPFLYTHNRHNEFGLNLGLISFALDHAKYRARLGLQAGTYARDNYAAEPVEYRSIFEAQVGVSLSKKNDLWLDAGVFPSHLGFESAITSDNLTQTRSLAAENSPYYLSGAKLTYEPDNRWLVSGVVCNGWQRIRRVQGNSQLSVGTQVSFSPSENVTLNWSTFYGSDAPDSVGQRLVFNDLYATFSVGNQWEFAAGLDVGHIKTNDNPNGPWYAATAIARRKIKEKWAISGRVEQFSDRDSRILFAPLRGNGLVGTSLGLDWSPNENVMLRNEIRYLSGTGTPLGEDLENRTFFTTSLAVKLGN